jgi:hypothetical protein
MKIILSTLFLLPFVLAQAKDSTNATTADCPSGFTPFQDPPGTSNIKCKKVEAGGRVDIVCPGTNRDYVDVVRPTLIVCISKSDADTLRTQAPIYVALWTNSLSHTTTRPGKVL